jgi:hypothetical protein
LFPQTGAPTQIDAWIRTCFDDRFGGQLLRVGELYNYSSKFSDMMRMRLCQTDSIFAPTVGLQHQLIARTGI